MDTPYLLVWERQERPTAHSFDRGDVTREAMALADADGLDAVSMRNVASRLGVGPMRLYKKVAGKEEILDLLVEAGYAEIRARLRRRRDPRRVVREVAVATRRVVLDHDWLAELLAGRPRLGPEALAVLEIEASALLALTEDVDAAQQARATLSSYVVGAVLAEVGERRAARGSGLDEAAWQRAVGPYLTRTFAAGEHPGLQRLVVEALDVPAATVFERGLDAVLAAVAPARDRP